MAETAEAFLEEEELRTTSHLNDLLPVLQRLDRLLERAVRAAQSVYGTQAALDPYRGLYIHPDEVARLLTREPGIPILHIEHESSAPSANLEPDKLSEQQRGGLFSFVDRWRPKQPSTDEMMPETGEQPGYANEVTSADQTDDPSSSTFSLASQQETEAPIPDPVSEGTRLGWLAQTFGLSAFDLDLLVIALAPEFDLRYERLYAYLQDDVSSRRPSVDLALNLLCTSVEEKLIRRSHFSPDAPLIRHNVIHLIRDPNKVHPPLLAHYLKLDERIVRLLLGQLGLDSRLVPFCQLIEPTISLNELLLTAKMKQTLQMLILRARNVGWPLRLYFNGPRGAGRRHTAEALADTIGAPLLTADLARILAINTDFEEILKILFREAWFQDAVLYLDNLDTLRNDERIIQYEQLLDALIEASGITILVGSQPWVPPGRGLTGVVSVSFPIPDFDERRAYWDSNLNRVGTKISEQELDALADRFRLTPHQIADVVDTAFNLAQWNAAQENHDGTANLTTQPTTSDLFTAARAQSGQNLGMLARKIKPKYVWDDIVLPADQLDQLTEICNQAKNRHIVYGGWGFGPKLSLGKGLNVLFSGPPGTGKTMAAEIIANELQLDLYKIDLSQVVSKYIGETEKNLDRIFTAAENANAILFFDEADALFGKRSEVRDSHDRYANIEISYLLQKMEHYEGVAILATNLRRNLDEAFVRRLAFNVHFPFPDDSSRRLIWIGIWPAETPVADEVDLGFLARQFKLSGGNIKNVALAAAFLAAANGRSVMMTHLIQATKREYQKMGKPCTEAEFGPYFHLIREPDRI